MKRNAIILGLLASFALGDLVGPTDTASASSTYVTGMNQVVAELRGIRRAIERASR